MSATFSPKIWNPSTGQTSNQNSPYTNLIVTLWPRIHMHVPKQRAVLLYTKRILTLRCPTLYNEYSDSALSYFIQSGFWHCAVLLYTTRILTLRCPTLYKADSDSKLSYFIHRGFWLCAVLLYTTQILTLRFPTLYNADSDSALSSFIQCRFWLCAVLIYTKRILTLQNLGQNVYFQPINCENSWFRDAIYCTKKELTFRKKCKFYMYFKDLGDDTV